MEKRDRVFRIEGTMVPGQSGEPDRWRRPGPLWAATVGGEDD